MVTPSVPAPAVPMLLTFNGGLVDTAGFLAIQGLFTAHVTGNFVTIGAALVSGTTGVLTKLLALPVFCIFVLLCRVLGVRWERQGAPVLNRLLLLHLGLLTAGCMLAIGALPATAADEWPALIAGLLLVAAMATQNGLHRMHLTSSPPSTLMTGTTTQIMVDLADLLSSNAAQPLWPGCDQWSFRSLSLPQGAAWPLSLITGLAPGALLSRRWSLAPHWSR